MKFSPLFWPVREKGSYIYVLDETRLPAEMKYIRIKDYKEACCLIKEMKTRAIGQVLLVMYAFLQEIRKNKLRNIDKVAKGLNLSRPTLSFKMLTDIVLAWAKGQESAEKNIRAFLDALKEKRIQQARHASKLLKDKDVILTHCNVSGLMPLIGQFCLRENKHITFFTTETRPYLQGSRLTAWELQRAGFKVIIISDNMVAKVMSEGKISKVIVGADHLALNGDIANKIGTYQIALLAGHFGIPFYVLCPPPSGAKSGKDIKIEIRPQSELLEYQGLRLAPRGAKAYYPAFDITPNNLITKHIRLEI